MNGNVCRHEIKMHNQVLSSTFKVYWIEDTIVLPSLDGYDHKVERQTILQRVKFH